MRYSRSKELFREASKHLVGGVNSPVRAFNSVGGDPLIIERGNGPYIYDVDGNEYIDFVGSYGPLILGHNHTEVSEQVKKAVDAGTTFGASTEIEIKLAELVKEAFPHADKVRFVNSGTEAIMSTLRLAKAYTEKDKVIKFSGCYHGHVDSLLVEAGSGLATQGLPGSKGVNSETVGNTLIAEFNNIESVKNLLENNSGQVAAIALEPVTGNMGVVKPTHDFLKKLRHLCDEHEALLIIDEVMTGFRNGFCGAQHAFDVKADITCLGKVIGGGLPVGAYCARSEIMDMVAPLGPVYQAGTLSGNPIAMTAGYYTLKHLKDNEDQVYKGLLSSTQRLFDGMEEIFEESNLNVSIESFGSMINPFFRASKPENYAEVKECDTKLFARFFRALLDEGIYIPPSQFETWFISTQHSKEIIHDSLKRIRRAVKAL